MWLSDLHECDWYNRLGLDPCNRVEQMEILRIHDNGLQGILVPELSILSTLYELTLLDNMITGTFPPEYSSLSELDTFVLAFNQFGGPVPEFTFRYPDMVYWDIGYNRFTGTLPQDIPQQMPNLEVMLMENNDIGGTIPTNLGTLNLRRVHMDDNKLTGTIPTELAAPPRLRQLYLHGNELTGPVPTEFANLPVLNYMTLHHNFLSGRPEGLQGEFDADSSICNKMGNAGNQIAVFSVDCALILCECCQCSETGPIDVP
jgi:Leucine-rich repeat (LRR) protein